MNQNKCSKLRRRLYQRYAKYEKYLVWLIVTLAFCAIAMWLAKRIFDIYLPFTSWKVFLESVGVLAFLFSCFSAWFTWGSNKKQAMTIAATRKEEQIIATLEKHSLAITRLENLRSVIASNSEAIEDVRSQLGRLSAQVQQTEAEAIMQRKIARIEDKLASLL
jgi:ABC-type multidrug transport system fused ATPase/permease subunit